MPSLSEIAGGFDLRIDTPRFFLRILSPNDCTPAYLSWLNDPAVSEYTSRFGKTHTETDMKAYVLDSLKSPHRVLFGIFLKESGRHIGNVIIDNYDPVNGLASIANMIGEKEYWGQGTAVEADSRLIHFGFQKLGIRKFTIGNMAPHRASTFMSTQLGFEKEALYKNHFAYDGGYVDVIYFGLFPDNFYKKFPELKNDGQS